MSDFQSGLMISVVGLVVTFGSLLIFIGVIVLLQKLFPVKKEKDALVVEEVKQVQITAQATDDTDEIAAALAAVVYLRSQRAGQLGSALLSGPGPYRTSR